MKLIGRNIHTRKILLGKNIIYCSLMHSKTVIVSYIGIIIHCTYYKFGLFHLTNVSSVAALNI